MRQPKLLPVVLVFLSAVAMAGPSVYSARTVLAEAKAASGGAAWNRIHFLKVYMKVQAGGMTGGLREEVNLKTGAYVAHFKLEPGTASVGFSGQSAWTKGMNGDVTLADSASSKAIAVTDAYLNSYGYWYPQQRTAKVKSIGTRIRHKIAYEVVRVTPLGGAPAELWFNAKTHLLSRTIVPNPFGKTVTTLSKYRTIHGVKIAFHNDQVSSQGNDVMTSVRSVQVNLPVPRSAFAVPGQVFNNTEVSQDAAAVTLPFKLINNHIYIQARIDNRRMQLLVDTGGANMVTPSVAQELGLKGRGDIRGHGVGKRSVRVQVAKVRQLRLGRRVTLRKQIFYIVPLTGLSAAEGTRVSGLIGFQVFKRFVVRINYARRRITLIQPDRFNPAKAGVAIPFTYSGHDPQINGSLDGIKGSFTIDTGSRGPLTLWAPFVARHDLLKRYKTTPLTVVGWGVGGTASARVSRARVLKLGPITLYNPVVELSTSDVGAAGNREVSGDIGGEILKRFTVTFDYAHNLLYIKANSDSKSPMHYDRSGMWINRARGGFLVEFVMPGGPAANAGLKRGDLITAVNHQSASQLPLYRLRTMLRDGAPGTTVKLAVDVGGKRRHMDLVLRRLVPKPRKHIT